MIRELTRNPAHRFSPYIETGSYPWYRECGNIRPTPEEAYEDAVKWAVDYEAADRYGNMASAFGVIEAPNGWRGVVNYYHSNT